jgi:hypothetical protein
MGILLTQQLLDAAVINRMILYYYVIQFDAVRSLGIPPPPGTAWWGGRGQPENLSAASSISGVGKRMLRWRCDARVCMPLLIEILARQKVAPAFEPQKGEQKDGPRIPVQCYGCLRSSRVGVLRVFST